MRVILACLILSGCNTTTGDNMIIAGVFAAQLLFANEIGLFE